MCQCIHKELFDAMLPHACHVMTHPSMRSTTHSTAPSRGELLWHHLHVCNIAKKSHEQAHQERPNMARTKQTARKSAGGVPHKPLLARKKVARKALPTTVGIKRRKLAPGVGALKYVDETLLNARLNHFRAV